MHRFLHVVGTVILVTPIMICSMICVLMGGLLVLMPSFLIGMHIFFGMPLPDDMTMLSVSTALLCGFLLIALAIYLQKLENKILSRV